MKNDFRFSWLVELIGCAVFGYVYSLITCAGVMILLDQSVQIWRFFLAAGMIDVPMTIILLSFEVKE